jgi:hypothetical protein
MPTSWSAPPPESTKGAAELPRSWTILSEMVKVRDTKCLISGYPEYLTTAHIVNKEDNAWVRIICSSSPYCCPNIWLFSWLRIIWNTILVKNCRFTNVRQTCSVFDMIYTLADLMRANSSSCRNAENSSFIFLNQVYELQRTITMLSSTTTVPYLTKLFMLDSHGP